MSHVVYEVIQHDGGWADPVGGTVSETYPNCDLAHKAAASAAGEQRAPGETTSIETRRPTANGAEGAREWRRPAGDGREGLEGSFTILRYPRESGNEIVELAAPAGAFIRER